jgi:hypothetical protein
MADALRLSASRAVPVAIEEAFPRVLTVPLPDLFSRRYGPIPRVRGTLGPATWDAVGLTRTVQLADGGRMAEELTVVDPPRRFAYRLTGFTGPMRPLASSIDGEWAFEPAGTGTRITWSWVVHPASSVASYALPVFGRIWRGYARQALEEVERLLLV